MRVTMIVAALCLGLQLYGQGTGRASGPMADTLQMKGTLADTVQISSASVTAQGAAQQIRQGAYSASAVDVGAQVATLQTLSQAIVRTSGIRIRSQGGVGSEFDLSVNGLPVNSVTALIGAPVVAAVLFKRRKEDSGE